MNNQALLRMLEIQFPGETITWVGESSWNPLFPFCFGTEDGQIRLHSLAGQGGRPPLRVVESGEAINGVADVNDLMAVSTRSEVVFFRLDPSGSAREVYRYEGGAHGVISTPSGRMIAPLGPNGLLVVGIRNQEPFRKEVIPKGRDYYFYKVASL